MDNKVSRKPNGTSSGEYMNKIMVLFLLGLTTLILWSCAAPRKLVTRQEWLDATTHTFKDKTIDEVLIAAAQVLRASNQRNNDVTIQHLPNKIIGSRRAALFWLFGGVDNTYIYDITANQQGNDVVVGLTISNNIDQWALMLFIIPISSSIRIPIIEYPDTYDLFFRRMESILYGSRWYSCNEMQELIRPGYDKAPPAYNALCFLAKDHRPTLR